MLFDAQRTKISYGVLRCNCIWEKWENVEGEVGCLIYNVSIRRNFLYYYFSIKKYQDDDDDDMNRWMTI